MEAGRLIVLTGPSGVGKGTLLRQLLKRHPQLDLSISATTRQPRPGEVHGKHYYFVSRDQFEEMMIGGELLEWAEYAGNYYGTPSLPVKQLLEKGRSVILEIELVGARKINKTFPSALRIFVLPPSLDELEQRIRLRGKDSEEVIAQRLSIAKAEIEAADEFDVTIVNKDFKEALQSLEAVIFPSPN
ncbi:guanylate kinase [Moorena sp. SIO3H5]|uniref:guanylate kinase n=1 Tax=Moorena sp. SIO3H5 TaxID=2607834 RepID=UPI0013BBA570|nr:guanylate kinase [Moorena sp. SIO3H5]NEO74296.1 guanylate kinase [Moorena sp. SIO3H5]